MCRRVQMIHLFPHRWTFVLPVKPDDVFFPKSLPTCRASLSVRLIHHALAPAVMSFARVWLTC